MTRKTKLAVVGCLLLVGVIVALVTTFREESVSISLVGSTNGGTRVSFQLNGPTNALYHLQVEAYRPGGWINDPTRFDDPAQPANFSLSWADRIDAAMRNVSPGKPFTLFAPDSDRWRCHVDVVPENWKRRTLIRLRSGGFPIPRWLITNGQTRIYSPEITR